MKGAEVTERGLGRVLGRIGDACASIGSQLVHELTSRTPSSLRSPFLLGFALVYGFWFLYGVRFTALVILKASGA